MDGHALLGELALYSVNCADGGPRGCRRRGAQLPEKYLPGRFLAGMRAEARAAVVRAVNNKATVPAPWFLSIVTDEVQHRYALAPPPRDRRWSCRGRWATPSLTAATPSATRRRAEASR